MEDEEDHPKGAHDTNIDPREYRAQSITLACTSVAVEKVVDALGSCVVMFHGRYHGPSRGYREGCCCD